jgi:hypothetical protein
MPSPRSSRSAAGVMSHSATPPGTADRFAVAFEALNGRTPRIDETKDALRYIGVIKQTGLDPFLLSYIADANNREQRQQFAGQLRATVSDALTQIREAIPTGSEMSARLHGIETFRRTIASAEQTAHGTVNFLARSGIKITAIAGGFFAIIILIIAERLSKRLGSRLLSALQPASLCAPQ